MRRLGPKRFARKRPRHEAETVEGGDTPLDEALAPPEVSTPLAVGSDCTHVLDLSSTLAQAGATGQNFICVPLFHPRLRRGGVQRDGPITRSEMALEVQSDWGEHVIGKISPWIDLDSCHDPSRLNAEKCFHEEYAFASHLGLQAVLFSPRTVGPNTMRTLKLTLTKSVLTSPQIWLVLPFADPHQAWQTWDRVRYFTDHDRRMAVTLALDATRMPRLADLHVQAWIAEPLKAVILPTELFHKEDGKAMSLGSAQDRKFLQWAMHRPAQIILRGPGVQETSVRDFVRALTRLHARPWDASASTSGVRRLQKRFNSKFRDTLQSPLDPLCVNLDSETYQVMEEDPVKYQLYADALHAAMRDAVHRRRGNEGAALTLRVLVVGPGRGPLVAATLARFKQLRAELGEALPQLKVKLDVVAVEKNPNAVVTLRNRFANQIAKKIVRIVSGDMRQVLKQPRGVAEAVDVIVSELLGSWGDNEASPECLDAVQHVLRPGGAMIPQSYCSYVAPISSSKLWVDAREMFWGARGIHAAKDGLDCPYVVQMESFLPLAAPQPVFEFHHPSLAGAGNALRQERHLRFSPQSRGVLHGFGAYFSCTLYQNITMSTVPGDHSEGMFSWFPAFLPIRAPATVEPDDKVTLDVWRLSDPGEKMWYEWACSVSAGDRVVQQMPLQNIDAGSFSVRL